MKIVLSPGGLRVSPGPGAGGPGQSRLSEPDAQLEPPGRRSVTVTSHGHGHGDRRGRLRVMMNLNMMLGGAAGAGRRRPGGPAAAGQAVALGGKLITGIT